jgi:hypothetical protein
LFRASDSLGWCYQFWQARKKKEVNASEVKIGADELPAVTQLVHRAVHGAVSAAQHAGGVVGGGRQGAAAGPSEMPYLRRLDDGTPAAGTFSGWPRLAREREGARPLLRLGPLPRGVPSRSSSRSVSPKRA